MRPASVLTAGVKYYPPPAYVVEHWGEREAVRATSPAQACLTVCENRFFGHQGLYRAVRSSWLFGKDYDDHRKALASADMRGGVAVEITADGAQYAPAQRAGRGA